MSRNFALIGDSNLKRFVTMVNRRACPALGSAQVLNCGKLVVFEQILSEIRPEADVCVVACLTNFLTDAADNTLSASVRVEAGLQEAHRLIRDVCQADPDRFIIIHPPMYRTCPLWYRDGLPEILTKFSSVFSVDRPDNCLIMSGFATPDFDSDGVHLTPSSGLEYIFHLFDASEAAIAQMKRSVPEAISHSSEASRVLEDRVMALEQDHRRLNRSFELSSAISAEREDFQENIRNEIYFMVSGLPLIKDLRGKDWMDKAILDVQGVILALLGREPKIVVVHNASGRKDTVARYSVRMESAAVSQEIRFKFGSFFVGGKDKRPEALKAVSISNKVTPGTQVRIMILKLLARRYLNANPDARAKVIGYEARPLLKLTPADTSVQHRVKSYNYIEAISKLPTCFTVSELRPIIAKARIHFRGSLRQIFGVLTDDFMASEVVDVSEVNEVDSGSNGSNAPSTGSDASQVQQRVQQTRKRAAPEAVGSGSGGQRSKR